MKLSARLAAGLVAASVLFGATAHATHAKNGRYLNGRYLNGRYLNGRYLNTAFLTAGSAGGVAIAGITKDGAPVRGVRLDGSELVSRTTTFFGGRFRTSEVRGDWFVNAKLGASTVDDSGAVTPATLVITRYEAANGGVRPNGLLRLPYARYYVSLEVPATATAPASLAPICGYEDDGVTPVPAIATAGEWNYKEGQPGGGAHVSTDPSRVTFACTNAAIGKCIDKMDYRPWESEYVEECNPGQPCTWVYRDLVDVHQACTRMVRADYCGDGVTHTEDNTDIVVYDDLGGEPAPEGGGFHLETRHNVLDVALPSPEWQFEAAWTSRGASIASCSRLREEVTTCPVYRPLPNGGWWPTFDATVTPQWVCHDEQKVLYGVSAVIGNARMREKLVPRLPFGGLGR